MNIELNEQQIVWLIENLNYQLEGDFLNNTSKVIANQILSKLHD